MLYYIKHTIYGNFKKPNTTWVFSSSDLKVISVNLEKGVYLIYYKNI